MFKKWIDLQLFMQNRYKFNSDPKIEYKCKCLKIGQPTQLFLIEIGLLVKEQVNPDCSKKAGLTAALIRPEFFLLFYSFLLSSLLIDNN